MKCEKQDFFSSARRNVSKSSDNAPYLVSHNAGSNIALDPVRDKISGTDIATECCHGHFQNMTFSPADARNVITSIHSFISLLGNCFEIDYWGTSGLTKSVSLLNSLSFTWVDAIRFSREQKLSKQETFV